MLSPTSQLSGHIAAIVSVGYKRYLLRLRNLKPQCPRSNNHLPKPEYREP